MPPPVHGDGNDVTSGIKPAAPKHAGKLLTNVAFESGKGRMKHK